MTDRPYSDAVLKVTVDALHEKFPDLDIHEEALDTVLSAVASFCGPIGDDILKCPVDLEHQTNWVLTGAVPMDIFDGRVKTHILWCWECQKTLVVDL